MESRRERRRPHLEEARSIRNKRYNTPGWRFLIGWRSHDDQERNGSSVDKKQQRQSSAILAGLTASSQLERVIELAAVALARPSCAVPSSGCVSKFDDRLVCRYEGE